MDATANSLALGTQFTISTWVNLTSEDDESTLLNKWDTGDANFQEFRLYTAGRFVKFDYNTTTADTYPDTGPGRGRLLLRPLLRV